jgi:hypothetical protein
LAAYASGHTIEWHASGRNQGQSIRAEDGERLPVRTHSLDPASVFGDPRGPYPGDGHRLHPIVWRTAMAYDHVREGSPRMHLTIWVHTCANT